MSPEQRDSYIRSAGSLAEDSRAAEAPKTRQSDNSPLSVWQERLLSFCSLDQLSRSYHAVRGIRLAADLNADALTASVTALIECHQQLRTYVRLDSQTGALSLRTAQVAEIAGGLDLSARDLRGASSDAVQQELQSIVSWPLDPTVAQTFHATLLRLRDHHLMVLLFHPLLIDDWSTHVIANEIIRLYAAHTSRIQSAGSFTGDGLPVPRIGERVTAQARRMQEEYWRLRVAGAPAAGVFSGYIANEAVPERQAVSYRSAPSATAEKNVEKIARGVRATHFEILLAIISVWLSLRTGRADLLIGMFADGRGSGMGHRAIGCFTNLVIFRIQPTRGLTLAQNIAKVKQTLAEDLSNQGGVSQPLQTDYTDFDLLLTYRDRTGDALPALLLPIPALPSGCPLTIHLDERPEGLSICLTGDAGRFSYAEAACMVHEVNQLLSYAVGHLQHPINGFPLSSSGASHSLAETLLLDIWKEVLGRDDISLDDHYYDLGGDSISSLRIIHKASAAGFRIATSDLNGHPTIRSMAAHAHLVNGVAVPVKTPRIADALSSELPLLPAQIRFFETIDKDRDRYNISRLLAIPNHMALDLLRQAAMLMSHRHGALRVKFRPPMGPAGSWTQAIAGVEECIGFDSVDLSALSAERKTGAVADNAASWQMRLSITDGPLVHLGVCWLGESEPVRLCFTMHHLVSDAVSLSVFVQDFFGVYDKLQAGHIQSKLQFDTYAAWSENLVTHGGSAKIGQLARKFLSLPWQKLVGEQIPLPLEMPFINQRYYLASMSEQEFLALSRNTIPRLHTSMQDVLLAALGKSYLTITGRDWLYADVLEHGRSWSPGGTDISQTVGWFAFPRPFLLKSGGCPSFEELVASVREQWGHVPMLSGDFGIARYYSTSTAELCALPRASVLFNYVGNMDSVLPNGVTVAPESLRETAGPQQRETYAVKFTGRVRQGALDLLFAYDPEAMRLLAPQLPAENLFGWLSDLMLEYLRSII